MPRLSSRQRRARDVLQAFLEHHTTRLKAMLRRKNKSKRNFARAGLAPEDIEDLNNNVLSLAHICETVSIDMASDSTSNTGSSIDSSISSGLSSNRSESTLDWSDLLGSDWRGSSTSTSTATSTDSLFDASDSMPDLHPLGYPDSDEEDVAVTSDSSSETSTSTASSGGEGDDESGWGEELGPEDDLAYGGRRTNTGARWVRHNLEEMYSARYELARDAFPHPPGPSLLRHTLGVLKDTRPDLFRQEIRMSPFTFDKIVTKLAGDPVFANNSSNGQMPVEDQLAITLYRFGHSGNAAALQKVANWAGVGKGTITLVTRRVMTAILHPDFMAEAVRMPMEAEKKEAKSWVEAHSCRAWRDGWCMVDGTLVVLFDRPFWFGESYFDRKCNYSLNVQVVNLPNLRIIDFGYGFTGSTHDSTAWAETRLAQERETLLEDGEFIWADSAYTLEKWMVAPFKKPFSLEPRNEEFNNHVSMVRIRSEHAIGFLKGRFHSLKGLRVNIKDAKTHQFATYWVAACIGVHSYAMQCEAEERGSDGDDDAVMADPFIEEGRSSSSSLSNRALY